MQKFGDLEFPDDWQGALAGRCDVCGAGPHAAPNKWHTIGKEKDDPKWPDWYLCENCFGDVKAFLEQQRQDFQSGKRVND